jgi:hypothetical protein
MFPHRKIYCKGKEKGCRRLQNEQIYDLCSSPNIICLIKSRRIGGVGHVTRIWGEKRVTESFGGKTEKKRKVVGPRCRWESNSKMKF